MSGGMRGLGRNALEHEVMGVLAADASASMAEVAASIGVGRTTLYRHFNDREAMVAAVARRGARMFITALMSARPTEGSGLAAVERVCERLFAVPDVLTLMFADHPIITDEVFAEVRAEQITVGSSDSQPSADALSAGPGGDSITEDDGVPGKDAADEDPLVWIIRRGQDDGSITSEVPAEWASAYVFLTIGAGHLHAMLDKSNGALSREAALALTVRAVRKTLGNPSTPT